MLKNSLFPLLIFLFIPVFTFCQHPFLLSGKLPHQYEGDTINIDIDNVFENKSFKIAIKPEGFSIRGTMKSLFSSVYIYITKNGKWMDTSFFIGEKPAELICNKTDTSLNPFTKCKYINTYFQDIASKFNAAISTHYDKFLEKYHAYKVSDASLKDSCRKVFAEAQDEYFFQILNFIKNNSASYFSLSYFNSFFVHRNYFSPDSLLAIYNSAFPKKLLESDEGREIKKNILRKKIMDSSPIAPDFSAKDINDIIVVYPSKIPTQYTLLCFWASWCVPCVEEIPLIHRIQRAYPINKLRIISASLDIDKLKWSNGVKKYNLYWENINDLTVVRKYAVYAIPSIFLISPSGKIIYNSIKDNDNEKLEKLNSLLTEKIQ